MFDVDKLYTYMYSTKEIDDDNGRSKIVRDNSKSLYNDLLDIHLSVFDNNNPELYKLILSPNGFGQLKTGNGGGLAAEIDALKTKAGRPQYNYLSSQYQMMKFFNGTSGKAGCLGVDTKVLMHDGSFKKVQDVVVGDQLMGIDSAPRNVLELCRGVEQMYNVIQKRGINYRVNESHILSLHHFDPAIYHKPQRNFIRTIDRTKVLRERSEYVLNIKLSDFLTKTNQFKNNSHGYKSSGIEFINKEVLIDPYYIGLWLGDGRTNDIKEIATIDFEIEEYLESTYGIKCSYGPKNISKRCYPEKLNWAFKKEFSVTKCGLNPGEKYIPNNYLYNSKENRLKLLAGLIDSDGTYCKINKQYIFSNVNKTIVDQLIFLTRSLGFYTSVSEISARISKRGLNEQKLYVVRFIPECDIPVLLPRKKQVEKSDFKNRLHTGILIEKDIVDNYYGFVLDGDHLFMLEDFTVTHNTGVFSSLAMLNAITQNKGLKYVHTNEELQDIFHVKFGGIESDGSIGLLKTLNNSDYTSKVIEAFQSASVDNEKEQILYKLNINKHTFNAINALSLLGFDESVICYFINQPIIEEYVKRASEKDSSLRKFEESLTGDIYGDLIQEFSDKYKTKPDYTATDYGVEDLKKQIETPERDNNETKQRGRDSEFWGKQLALLEKFKSIDDIGLNLQSLMQTVNAESKGLGKTLFGSLDRAEKIDNIDSVTDRYGIDSVKGVLNAGRILYDYDKETGEYILDEFQSKQTNSLNGFVAEYGTTELNRIGEKLLPYNNKIIKSIFDYTSSVLDRKGNSINSNEEFMSETFTKMKSYLFSNTELFGGRFDILNERKRLFLGTSKFIDGKLQVENPSLPEIIAALKTDENGIANTNALLRQLVPDTRRKSSDMDLLKYTASTGQNLDESELHQAFIALFRESPVLEFKIGNKLHSIDGRTLAEDLIKYVYLSGGTQEAIQFTRYIPIEVLNYMGFSDKLKTIADGFSPSIFGVSLDEKGNVIDSNITEQILQHEPSLLITCCLLLE